MIGLLGFAVFSNFGLIAILYILLMQWWREQPLDESVSIALMAMIYYIFYSVNLVTYIGITIGQTLLAIVERISSVLVLENYESDRQLDVKP